MFKNISLGILGVFALTLFTFPIYAQESRELTDDQSVIYQQQAPSDTSTSDEYQYLYDKLSNDGEYSIDTSELTPDEQAALAGFTALTGGFLTALTGGLLLVVIAISTVVSIALYVFMSWAYMIIAKKLNMENAWFAWVPVLNLILMAQIGDINPWTLLLIIIPFVNVFYLIYFLVVSSMKMSEKLGLDKYLGLLMFVPVVQYVFLGYLAWGKYEKKQVSK